MLDVVQIQIVILNSRMTIISKYKWQLIGSVLGGIIGFLYWQQIGCENGCPLKSRWQTMVPYGILMGYLLSDLAISFFKTQKTH
jgi:hypothetical protein